MPRRRTVLLLQLKDRRIGWCLLICLSVICSALHTSTRLSAQPPTQPPAKSPLVPPESVLPQEAYPIQRVDAPNGDSPHQPVLDESILPGEQSKQDPTGNGHPGESVLPLSDSGTEQGANQLAADIRPLLRLDLSGHTGAVRTLDGAGNANEATLVSAGDDKDVHVWMRSAITQNRWVHRRTIRWPVLRGPRGRIYSVALHGDQIALAGHGATGGLGEIWIVDANTGELVRALVGNDIHSHRQTIATLRWSPQLQRPSELQPSPQLQRSPELANAKQPTLASVDVEGRVLIWKSDPSTGLWSGNTIVKSDAEVYGEPAAQALRSRRRFVPITFCGPDHVVVAMYVGPADKPAGAAKWQLQRVNVLSGKATPIDQSDMIEFVVAMDASDDGRVLVTSDALGNAKRFRFDAESKLIDATDLKTDGVPLSIDVDSDGGYAVITTTASSTPGGGAIQRWNLQKPIPERLSSRPTNELPTDAITLASPVSDTFKQIVATSRNRLHIHTVDDSGSISAKPDQELATRTGAATRVAFVKNDAEPKTERGTYRIAIARDGQAPSEVFDLSKVKLEGQKPVDTDGLLKVQRLTDRWTAGLLGTEQGQRYRLFRDGKPVGILPLIPELHGTVTSIATIPNLDEPKKTGAVVIGTSGRNNLYVFAADDSNPPRLIRQFRGHSGDVLSLSVSEDGKYLASGSGDSTIAIWNLQDWSRLPETTNRWGVDFQVSDGRLIAASVRDDGPLYFRGARGGDQLIAIRWADRNGKASAETDPAKILTALQSLPFDALVVFEFTRLGRPLQGFQSFAAWQPLATLMIDRDREWAYWTPAGYYDASINGHRRFGWQINRGVRALPDYYQAAQFRETLERPNIMRRLLQAGSLPRAMRESLTGLAPPPGETAIVNQIRNQPSITITQPAAGQFIQGDTLLVRADVQVPSGDLIAPPKAFVNGIPAVAMKHLNPADAAADAKRSFEWKFRLPSATNLQLEVFAASEAQAVGRASRLFQHSPAKRPDPDSDPPRKPRLHVLAIGISEYRDRQIQPLDFAARAADVISQSLRKHAGDHYDVTTEQLTNDDATRSIWKVYASAAVERLSKTVGPDDLVIMYLCGHGLRDRRTDQWYFVAADAKYSDLMNDRYDDCLSLSDLAVFAKLPCTKLAILDSCHSGAVQTSMRPDDLKSALRFLQDDVVLTWTASEGDQEAAERVESKLGRFTTHLNAALAGAADSSGGNGDGLVSLTEAIDFVSRQVRNESVAEGQPQHPTASPANLIRFIDLPLTGSRQQSKPSPALVKRKQTAK